MTANLLVTEVQKSLSSNSDLPTDIKFLFKEEADSGPIVKEVRAHKLILALVSNVFRTGFYGGITDDGKIVIEDATKEAFEVMIEFIYNKITDLSNFEFDILCETYYLSDKYNINLLKEETLRSIRIKDISARNVLDVINLAEQHSAHEELAETLCEAVSHRLSIEFCGKLSKAAEFCKNIYADATPMSRCLLRVLGGLKTVQPALCGNCKATPCKTGLGITREHFVPGAAVSAVAGRGHPACEKLSRMNGYKNFCGVSKDGQLFEYLTLDPSCYVFNCEDSS